MTDRADYLLKEYTRKAENLFTRLKTPFDYITSERADDVKEIASTLYAAHLNGRNHEKDVVIEDNRKSIDEEIERVLKVILQAQAVMVSYKKMGYGDEVYMDALCKAIDAADDAVAHYSNLASS